MEVGKVPVFSEEERRQAVWAGLPGRGLPSWLVRALAEARGGAWGREPRIPPVPPADFVCAPLSLAYGFIRQQAVKGSLWAEWGLPWRCFSPSPLYLPRQGLSSTLRLVGGPCQGWGSSLATPTATLAQVGGAPPLSWALCKRLQPPVLGPWAVPVVGGRGTLGDEPYLLGGSSVRWVSAV